jgi:hypothetical protein
VHYLVDFHVGVLGDPVQVFGDAREDGWPAYFAPEGDAERGDSNQFASGLFGATSYFFVKLFNFITILPIIKRSSSGSTILALIRELCQACF